MDEAGVEVMECGRQVKHVKVKVSERGKKVGGGLGGEGGGVEGLETCRETSCLGDELVKPFSCCGGGASLVAVNLISRVKCHKC